MAERNQVSLCRGLVNLRLRGCRSRHQSRVSHASALLSQTASAAALQRPSLPNCDSLRTPAVASYPSLPLSIFYDLRCVYIMIRCTASYRAFERQLCAFERQLCAAELAITLNAVDLALSNEISRRPWCCKQERSCEWSCTCNAARVEFFRWSTRWSGHAFVVACRHPFHTGLKMKP